MSMPRGSCTLAKCATENPAGREAAVRSVIVGDGSSCAALVRTALPLTAERRSAGRVPTACSGPPHPIYYIRRAVSALGRWRQPGGLRGLLPLLALGLQPLLLLALVERVVFDPLVDVAFRQHVHREAVDHHGGDAEQRDGRAERQEDGGPIEATAASGGIPEVVAARERVGVVVEPADEHLGLALSDVFVEVAIPIEGDHQDGTVGRHVGERGIGRREHVRHLEEVDAGSQVGRHILAAIVQVVGARVREGEVDCHACEDGEALHLRQHVLRGRAAVVRLRRAPAQDCAALPFAALAGTDTELAHRRRALWAIGVGRAGVFYAQRGASAAALPGHVGVVGRQEERSLLLGRIHNVYGILDAHGGQPVLGGRLTAVPRRVSNALHLDRDRANALLL
eukprot:scaffold42937_cov70-Phaeocystis_antarctica.AAC.2